MNEKLEALFNEAVKAQCLADNGQTGDNSQAILQRFAELIVKDCLKCCDMAGKIEWPEPPTYDLAVETCKFKITQIMGVKE